MEQEQLLHGVREIVRKEIGDFAIATDRRFNGVDRNFKHLDDGIRTLGVFAEKTKDEIKLVAEQYGDMKKTLADHGRTLDVHTEMIGALAVDMSIIKEDIQDIRKASKYERTH